MQFPSLRVTGIAIALFVFFPFFSRQSLAATNLLTNPGAETGDTSGWTATAGLGIISGHDNGWGVAGNPIHVRSGSHSFASSYAGASSSGPFDYDVLSQEIDLQDKGYSGGEMETEPDIFIETYVLGIDVGSGTDDPYRVKVELRDKNHAVLATYDTGDQVANGSWTHVSHTFSAYGSGVRYVYFEQNGRSSAWWDGNYGATFDDASVTVGDVSVDTARIDSWSAEIIEEKGDCSQKLKLTIQGRHFDDDAEVSIGDHDASSVHVLSSKKLTAKFCLEKLSKKKLLKKSIHVKNPHTDSRKADKKIDLSQFTQKTAPQTSENEDVKTLQALLVKLGYLDSQYVTGIYGPYTSNAVKKFQGDSGLDQTGNVGPLTQAKLAEKAE